MLCCLRGIINPIKLNLSNKFAPHQSLPLMREVDSPLGEDGGREYYPSVMLFA